MEPTPPPETTSQGRNTVEVEPDRVSAENDQTDQDIDTAGTEADEPAVGSALDKGVERESEDL